jgi:prophage regulatory protein
MTHDDVAGRRPGRRVLGYADLKTRGIRFSRVHLRRLEQAKKFPQHVNLGENSIGWFADEVDEFLEEKAAARHAKVRAHDRAAAEA